jgi:hypothetical protein
MSPLGIADVEGVCAGIVESAAEMLVGAAHTSINNAVASVNCSFREEKTLRDDMSNSTR